jgi:hypothetical protein
MKPIPCPGDVFRIQLPNGKNLFGRVVIANPPREQAPMPCAFLVYIYSLEANEQCPDYSKLSPENLLIPPVWTNELAWKKGYFNFVENHPLSRSDLLERHVFRSATGRLFDEKGKMLSGDAEPFGEWGMASYKWIQDRIRARLQNA